MGPTRTERLGRGVGARTVLGLPLVGTGGAGGQLPLVPVEIFQVAVIPLGRIGGPDDLQTAGDGILADTRVETLKANLNVRRCPRTGYGSVHGTILSDFSRVDIGHDFGIECGMEIKPEYMVHCGVSREMKGPLVTLDIPDEGKSMRIALGTVSEGHIAVNVSTEFRCSQGDGPLEVSQDSNASTAAS